MYGYIDMSKTKLSKEIIMMNPVRVLVDMYKCVTRVMCEYIAVRNNKFVGGL